MTITKRTKQMRENAYQSNYPRNNPKFKTFYLIINTVHEIFTKRK